MILSLERKFLFVKTKKTAGTSVEIALSSGCSDGDVITPIAPEDELVREKQGAVLPQNFSSSTRLEDKYRKSIRKGDVSRIDASLKRVERKKIYWNHMSASQIKETLSADVWEGLFKFSIDRHPYEKAVSQAFYRYSQQDSSGDFDEFLDLTVNQGQYRNIELYSNEDGLLVDMVLKFEELPACLSLVEKELGIDLRQNMPVTKNQFRRDHRPATEILNRAQKNTIVEHCRLEFELLGYDA